MLSALRFLLAVGSLPFAWAVVRVFADVFRLIPSSSGAVVSPVVLSLSAGMFAFLVLLMVFPVPVRLYVFGHELTHALFGLLFGARVSNLKVGLRGGSVQLTKSNVWITLSPYFFPFWTVAVVLLALTARCFFSPLPVPWLWQFSVGFTWSLHLCFTLRSLLQRQPDIEEYGRLFSYTLIWILNAVGMVAWIVCTSEVTWGQVWDRLLVRSCSAYRGVVQAFVWCYESVRPLPVLQK